MISAKDGSLSHLLDIFSFMMLEVLSFSPSSALTPPSHRPVPCIAIVPTCTLDRPRYIEKRYGTFHPIFFFFFFFFLFFPPVLSRSKELKISFLLLLPQYIYLTSESNSYSDFGPPHILIPSTSWDYRERERASCSSSLMF